MSENILEVDDIKFDVHDDKKISNEQQTSKDNSDMKPQTETLETTNVTATSVDQVQTNEKIREENKENSLPTDDKKKNKKSKIKSDIKKKNNSKRKHQAIPRRKERIEEEVVKKQHQEEEKREKDKERQQERILKDRKKKERKYSTVAKGTSGNTNSSNLSGYDREDKSKSGSYNSLNLDKDNRREEIKNEMSQLDKKNNKKVKKKLINMHANKKKEKIYETNPNSATPPSSEYENELSAL